MVPSMPARSAPTWQTRGSSAVHSGVSGLSSSASVARTASTARCVDMASCSSGSASESWADRSQWQWSQLSGFGLQRTVLCLAAQPLAADPMDAIDDERAMHRLEMVPLAPCAQRLLPAEQLVKCRRVHRDLGPFGGGDSARAACLPASGRHARVWRVGRAGERGGLHACMDSIVLTHL